MSATGWSWLRFLSRSPFGYTEWIWKQGLWPKFGHCSWAFVLEPRDGGKTRLIVRDRYRSGPLDLSVPFWPLFFVADLIVQPVMLRGFKRRVEWTSLQQHAPSVDESRDAGNCDR